MDANAQYELYTIKKELQGIIDELDSIGIGVRRDFSGVGNDRCADSIIGSANHYRSVKARLDRMDLSALSDEFLAKQREEAARRAAAEQAARQAAAASAQARSQPVPQPAPQPAAGGASSKKSSTKSKQKKTATSIVREAISWLFR